MTTAAPGTRPGLSRAVVWTGIALGTCLAVLAIWDGVRLRVGGMPSWLGVAVGALIVWAVIAGGSVALAELVRRHHKTAARFAVQQGKQGGAAAVRGTRRQGGRALARAASWAGPRWERRLGGGSSDGPGGTRLAAWWRARLAGPGPWLLHVRNRNGEPLSPGYGPEAGVAVYERADLQRRLAAAAGRPDLEVRVTPLPATETSTADGTAPEVCEYCGNPGGGKYGPLVSYPGEGLVHRAHFDDPEWAGRGPHAPSQQTEGTSPMTTGTGRSYQNGDFGKAVPGPSRITPARRARGVAARTGGTVPAEWNAVIARTADFEPDNDGELLDWMGQEVAGVAAYAEALVDLYESLTKGTGLDPAAMAALHDVADAQAHASETMSGARRKFADHYDRPREFAAEGGLMPHDGRWVTGEGDA
jgi:hypothetical protein